MKWAVEIKRTSLDRRNLVDLLQGLGCQVVEGVDFEAMYTPDFDRLGTAVEVWKAGVRVREAFTGPAEIDKDFELGAVIDYSSGELKRTVFTEVPTAHFEFSAGPITFEVGPPANLSEDELRKWKEEKAEADYQEKLRQQRHRLEPAYHDPRAVKILQALAQKDHTGVTLYKMYEIMEGSRSNRKSFQSQFGISKYEFERFGDAVHNPVVSGERARHAYELRKPTNNPMTIEEAERFVRLLANKWLASLR